jgi:hypothetical protein
MLKLVIKKVSTFSAAVLLGFALLMVDTDSPSLISEAHACDPFLFEQCYLQCGFACSSYLIPNCQPNWCDCQTYCYDECLAQTGCG